MDADAPVASVGDVADAVRTAGLDARVVGAVTGGATTPVASITHDSRAVVAGSMFACLRGAAFDGHAFAADAVASGAVALLVDHELPADTVGSAVQVVVADTRRAVGPAAATIAGEPSRRLTTVGITGTNGKTTTAQLVATILDGVAGDETALPTGVVGTLHGPRTTPEATDLQRLLAGFAADGRRAAVLEVSSHALALHRVDGTSFDVVAFTNFGEDHLDLHGTPEEYFRAKSRLFDSSFAPVAVIAVDDPHGRNLADVVAARTDEEAMTVVAVSRDEIDDVRVGAGRHEYRWRGHDVTVPIGGDFNVSNSLLALSIATELGIDAADAVRAIATTPAVPGRFERIASPAAARRGVEVVVDYAHTPDGLEQLLRTARDVGAASGRLVVVFGCGGERDRAKRPRMGEVAATLADRVIVTSDNPRHESPTAIIDEVLRGIPDRYRAATTSEPDRRGAIAAALDLATTGDVVVIAGKGHEGTQDLGDTIIDFDDRAVARALLDGSPEDAS